LERLEAYPLEQPTLVEDRHAPLLVVVGLHQRVAVPEAAHLRAFYAWLDIRSWS
jgi:hypothetical protein